jgi:phage gp36-like protein
MYITENDLILEFGAPEMTQLGTRDANAIISAMNWAESYVSGFLNTAGITPPTPTPNDLRGVVCDAVRWRLYDDALTDVVVIRFERAREWLTSVAAGRLVPSWANAEIDGGSGGIAYTEPTVVFTMMP